MKKQKKRRLSLMRKRMIAGYLFILPWLVGFVIIYIRSLFQTVQFSFSEMEIDAINGGYTLVANGWENYRYAFLEHGTFKQTLTSSVMNMLVDVPLITFFSLFMAMLLNKKFPGRALVRAIFFLPVILGSGAIVDAMEMSAKMMQTGVSGQAADMAAASTSVAFDIDYLISMFMNLGLPAKLMNYITSAVGRINDIISMSGVQIVIFIAALQSIPGSLYEVAKIEGATGYETFWKITFPMVMPHIITNVVYTIVDSFEESEILKLADTTTFTKLDYGIGSVMTITSTLITCIILVVVVGFIQKKTFYYN
ncbi:MAG: sugar ABC transporter permease [Lachnospiraceae bacterium]|nr:sugar ABC transporter permease [Lachnospiraceae bacterium]